MSDFSSSSLTLRKIIAVTGVVILILTISTYVLYQARNLIQGPSIELYGSYFPEHHEKTLLLEGQTHNIVKLTLNGKEIHTGADGSFSHTVILENGYSILTLHAQDRFGRTTSLVREYVYVPLDTPQDEV